MTTRGKVFNDTSFWNLKSNILYWEVETQKTGLMGNKINNGGKLHAWTREVTPPLKCILSILNSQGDFGVWLLTLAFIVLFIACPLTCYIIVVAHGLEESWEFKFINTFNYKFNVWLTIKNMLNGDHFMNKLSFTSILTI
jgi:hypothetical protein